MEKAEKKEAAPKGRDALVKNLYEAVGVLSSAIVIVMVCFTFVFRLVGVLQRSMQPTLYEGQSLIVGAMIRNPKYGDIVIVTDPTHANPLVKRVIAVGGQEIDIDFEEGEVYVDGKKLDEPYIAEKTQRQFDVEFPLTVPEGSIFVMGDNRNDSLDSRSADIGCVRIQCLLGKVYFRLAPGAWNVYEKTGSIQNG